MLENYIKIKFYEEIVGIGLVFVILLVLLLWFIVSHFINKWDLRQKRKSDKFWEEHGDE